MKATIAKIPPVPQKPTFRLELELTYREALALLAVCRHVGGTPKDETGPGPRLVTDAIEKQISDVLGREEVPEAGLTAGFQSHSALADSLLHVGSVSFRENNRTAYPQL